MVFRYMFAILAVGVGTALKLENAQNVEKRRKSNVACGFFAYSARWRLDSNIRDDT